MRSFIVGGVQVVISLGIAGLAMPVLFARIPATRESSLGPFVVVAIGVLAFALLRVTWPKRLK